MRSLFYCMPTANCAPHHAHVLHSCEQLDFDEAWGMFVKVCGGDMILEGSLRLMPLQVQRAREAPCVADLFRRRERERERDSDRDRDTVRDR